MQAERTFIEGMSYYVPAMTCGAALGQRREDMIDFGAPAVASETDISNDTIDADAGATTTLTFDKEADAPFGRNVQFAAAAAVGVGETVEITVHGRDYLGQHMQENVSVAHADGTTAVEGVKAFKHVDKFVHDGGGSVATTISAGWGPKLGLPYKTVNVEYELEDEVKAAAGTLTAPVLTDPQTATTGDPRGLYTPTGTLDGTANFKIWATFSDETNANDRGGLHGIAHYNG